MFQRLRRHMSYANVVATFALVFAMSGGALAASKYLITSSKQIKPSVLASLKGKAGANGAQGAAGAQGAQGPAGATGPKGENGTAGANGTAGTNGASVTSAPLGVGNEHCKEGGNEFVAASGPGYACNGKAGKEGKEGKEGSPWTAGGTLPSGKTETGSWSIGNLGGSAGTRGRHERIALSFPIQLKESLGAADVHYRPAEFPGLKSCGELVGVPLEECEKEVKEEEAKQKAIEAACPGSVEEPKATPGNLCVYESDNASMLLDGIAKLNRKGEAGASTAGALLNMEPLEEEGDAWGAWAVTEK